MANHRGGSGNFAEDRERASEAGRKVASTAGATLRMTRNALQRQAKGGKIATATTNRNCRAICQICRDA